VNKPPDIIVSIHPYLNDDQTPTGKVLASVCLAVGSRRIEVYETGPATKDATAERYAEDWINSQAGIKAIDLERRLLNTA